MDEDDRPHLQLVRDDDETTGPEEPCIWALCYRGVNVRGYQREYDELVVFTHEHTEEFIGASTVDGTAAVCWVLDALEAFRRENPEPSSFLKKALAAILVIPLLII